MNFIDLKKKTAVITGAGSGIGRATAILLNELGASVVLIDKNKNKLASTHKNCYVRDKSFRFVCDLTDFKAVKIAFNAIFKTVDNIDILVNVAGQWESAPFAKISHKKLANNYNINFLSCFNTIKVVSPSMLEKKYGKIICVSSIAGKIGASAAGASHYAASKGALLSFVRSLAREFGPRGVFINCVTPGLIDTPGSRKLGIAGMKAFGEKTALGRIGDPTEVASVIAFMVSDRCSYVTGQSWNVCGGYLVQ
jgi:NAD(P)-dependent dehydrogenase (short-subunit alcohol dehydrogenase family)